MQGFYWLHLTMFALGTLLLLFAVLRTASVSPSMKLIQGPAKAEMERLVRNQRGLMIFFLVGNTIVGVSVFLGWEGMDRGLVTWIFLLAAVFVLHSMLMQKAVVMEMTRTIEELVPVCASCKQIRVPDTDPEDPDSWTDVDLFLNQRGDMRVTHGICPSCKTTFYPEKFEEGDLSI